ncbi:MAG: hypothetical protein LBL90_07030, partial [Prevotellaceae bacterium]|nr:hypothetical protein [Prevotellaceae bacterium]
INKPFIPSRLAELDDDANHHTVTDAEKTAWNAKSNFSGNYNDLTNQPFIPGNLNELTGDANNRTVSDAEKTAWNAKSNFSGNYGDLNNIPELLTPEEVNTLVNNAVNNAVLAAFPAGCVIMWYGDPNNIPNGWEIFYQMGGRFPVGAHHISTDEGLTKYSFGDKGGEEKHALNIEEMPPHNHEIIQYDANNGTIYDNWVVHISQERASYSSGIMRPVGGRNGSVAPHENRPPYLAIYFIKKK